jgi:hypothetical protein
MFYNFHTTNTASQYGYIQLTSDVWQHLAITCQGGVVSVYVDGVQVGSVMAPYSISTSGAYPFVIGAWNAAGTSPPAAVSRYFKGSVNDIRIYSRALTTAEIQRLYLLEAPTSAPSSQPSSQPSRQPGSQPSSHPSTQPSSHPSSQPSSQPSLLDLNTNLVAYYPFNGNANDESGSGNNGVVHLATLTTDRFGVADSAYAFDGSSCYIEIVDGTPFDFESNFAVSLWILVGTTQVPNANIVDKSYGDGSGWTIEQASLNSFGFGYYVTSDVWSGDTGGTQFSSGTWQHYVVSKQDATLTIFVNGIYTKSIIAASSSVSPSQTKPLLFGAWNSQRTSPASGIALS